MSNAPAFTGSRESLLTIDKSATGVTVVFSVSVLLAGFGSETGELTLAVSIIVPLVVGAVTVMVIAGAAPKAKLARVQVTTPAAWLQLQPEPEALMNVTPAGKVSVTVTEVAVLGPALLT